MKALVILILLVIVMALIGWLSFSKSNGRATISVETQKIENDTKHAIQKGKEAIHETSQSIDHRKEAVPPDSRTDHP